MTETQQIFENKTSDFTNSLQMNAAVQEHQIKLLKFLTTFRFGGTERQVVNLVRNLDRTRFDLSFACMEKWGQFLHDIENEQIPINEYRINSLYKPKTMHQQMKFATHLRRQEIEIAHSYNFYANTFVVPAARLAGVPVVIASIRDTGMGVSPAKMRVHKLACRLADCVLVNADAVRDWLVEQGYQEEKIEVIRNGIDLSRFNQTPNGSAIRPELGIPEKAPIVVVLARMTPEKGLETFLDAAANVKSQHPDTRFLIVGDIYSQEKRDGIVEHLVAYQESLFKRATRLGLGDNVIFTGYRKDIPALLSEATVSVLSSRTGEGLSNSLLESMAAGVAVVATEVGGNPEVIGKNNESGVLIPPDDPDAMSQAISAIIKDSTVAKTMGMQAKQRVNKLFSLERMVRETELLYQSLIEKHNKKYRKYL